MRSLKSNP